MVRPLILLDRDGVINADTEKGVHTRDAFAFLPRALDAIAMLTQAGCALAICTNQSAVGRGWMTQETLDDIHRHMRQAIAAHGGRIEAIYVAPDAPDAATPRRKPGPGMLQEALQQFGAPAKHTPFIGDAARDIAAAYAAGCPGILVRTGKGAATEAEGFAEGAAPIHIADDLYDAAQYSLQHYAGGHLPEALG